MCDGTGDTSALAMWPSSAKKVVDLIELTCFALDGHDDATIKIGIKANKSAIEILEEYHPWRTQLQDIDEALKQENIVKPTFDADADEDPPKAMAATVVQESGKASTEQVATSLGTTCDGISENFINQAGRHLSIYGVGVRGGSPERLMFSV